LSSLPSPGSSPRTGSAARTPPSRSVSGPSTTRSPTSTCPGGSRTIPTTGRIARHYGTTRQDVGEFFRFQITGLDPPRHSAADRHAIATLTVPTSRSGAATSMVRRDAGLLESAPGGPRRGRSEHAERLGCGCVATLHRLPTLIEGPRPQADRIGVESVLPAELAPDPRRAPSPFPRWAEFP
jgi:hypothetical protein